MLKKFAALVMLVGLCLPFGRGFRPIADAWHGGWTVAFLGVPVLAVVIYGLHTVVPPLAAFHERSARALHGLFRVAYFALLGGYLAVAVTRRSDWPGLIGVAAALVVTGVLAVWPQHRGTAAARLPLLLLTVAGIPEVVSLTDLLGEGGLALGGWVFSAGWILAVLAEAYVLAASTTVASSG